MRRALDDPPVKGVLYDLDGVLIDSAKAWFRVLTRGTERFASPALGWEAFLGTFGQGVEADRDQFFPSATVDDVSRFYDEAFPEAIDAVEVADGAVDLLTAARAQGLKQAVVTNTPRELALRTLEATGLAPYLDAVAAAGDAPEKPAPDLIRVALRRLELAPIDVVYLGDSESDRGATRAAGVFLIGIGVAGEMSCAGLTDLLDRAPFRAS